MVVAIHLATPGMMAIASGKIEIHIEAKHDTVNINLIAISFRAFIVNFDLVGFSIFRANLVSTLQWKSKNEYHNNFGFYIFFVCVKSTQ